MKLAGYLRVSTEGQVDAFGKDVQRDAIERWAGLNGHEIVAWFEEDGVSGKTDGGDRPQETLLTLVWDAGLRVFTTTAGELSANDDDPTRILIRQILGVIAEFDHRNTVKRQGETLRSIADSLNRREIWTRGGKAWQAPQIMRIIRRYENT